MEIFNYYILLINIIGFIFCFIDKCKAKYNKYRISERILIMLCLIGGCYGFSISMFIFHHKTNKIKFIIFVPIIMIIWLIIIYEMNLHY